MSTATCMPILGGRAYHWSENHIEFVFDAINDHFIWTDNWYEFDEKKASKTAQSARREVAKKMRKDGWVTKMSSSLGLRRKGGLGTEHPDIEFHATTYRLNCTR